MAARAEVTTPGAVYKPEHLKIMIEAFDAAWSHIQRRPEISLQQVYRYRLADAVMALADEIDDLEALKQAALARLALT